jgi:hypothetical protein
VNTRYKLPVFCLWLLSAFLCIYLPASGQNENPFSVRVESDLVVVNIEVFDEGRAHEAYLAYRDCRKANKSMLYSLPFSEPFSPKDCLKPITIHGLGVGDFRVFEDGLEQKIESVRYEPEAYTSVRDNHNFHLEWSYTPRGKWSALDVGGWDPAPAHYVYRVAYVPTKREEGKCHRINVKVDRPHAAVYASDEYCYTTNPTTDPLNGSKLGSQMETDLIPRKRATVPVSMQASFVYTNSQTARVDLVLQFPWNLQHQWVAAVVPSETDLQASVGVLGVAYKNDGTVAARFSDLACCDSGRRFSGGLLASIINQSGNLPSRYEMQIDLPAGEEYELRVVLSDGENFGRAEIPLKVDSYDGKQLAISSVILSDRFRDAKVAAEEAAAVNLAPAYVPLVSKGLQFTPAAYTSFKSTDHLTAYFEIYEPLLADQPKTAVQAHIRILDGHTGEVRFQFAPIDANSYRRAGSTILAVAGDLPIAQLPQGDYRVDVQATESDGRSTPVRSCNFTIE